MTGENGMSNLDEPLRDLMIANRILAHEEVVDALGHVSIRHPYRSDRFFLSCSRSPELVALVDLMEYDLDCNPIDQRGRSMYLERPIHGAIYQARPDVGAIVHSHAYEVIPFGLTNTKLRPVIHPAYGLGKEVPIWDIRKTFGDTNMLVTTLEQGLDLATCLGKGRVALMRGHGCVVVGSNLKEAVLTSIYMKVNARLQAEAIRLGEIVFLSEGEIDKIALLFDNKIPIDRMWQYWCRRAGMDGS